jgi:rSAM/selenodomain-associated transferase 1
MRSSSSIAQLHDSNRILVIMAKAPRAGAVKTRLAQTLPPSAVVDFYRCLLDDTMALAKSLDGVEVAIMCPACDVDDLAVVAGEAVRVVAQTGVGLAAGLISVFAQYATAGRRRVIAFNSDSPHLPRTVLEGAFDALALFDLIVGPTYDGGYYLVGATASYPELFVGSGMGTANALEELLSRARALRLSVGFTDTFYDIDVPADLNRLAAELEAAADRAPRTAAWLKQWRLARGAAI